MYTGLHVKYPLILSDFNETGFFFFDRFSKDTQITNFQWEPSCSMWTDGQTYITKLIVAFCNFVNVPKKERM